MSGGGTEAGGDLDGNISVGKRLDGRELLFPCGDIIGYTK